MTHAHERQQEDSVELIEDALVMGKLMEVDWTKRTARLERFREKPIKLRFGKALAETMREYATQFVQIEGDGCIRAPDTDKEEWVDIEVRSVCVPYQGKGKVFRKEEWEKDLKKYGSLFGSNEELQDFIDLIREGRGRRR